MIRSCNCGKCRKESEHNLGFVWERKGDVISTKKNLGVSSGRYQLEIINANYFVSNIIIIFVVKFIQVSKH